MAKKDSGVGISKAAGRLPDVDQYIAKAQAFAQPVLEHLRGIIHKAAPDVTEEMKWSMPFFVYRGVILGHMAAFKQHCSFRLWGPEVGALVRADGFASTEGMGAFGRIKSLQDLPPQRKLLDYVKYAASLIDEGERTQSIARPKVAKAKRAVEVPEALTAALKKNKAAGLRFEAMSPSARREYSEWIAEAKREETRDKRVAEAVG